MSSVLQPTVKQEISLSFFPTTELYTVSEVTYICNNYTKYITAKLSLSALFYSIPNKHRKADAEVTYRIVSLNQNHNCYPQTLLAQHHSIVSLKPTICNKHII